MYPVYPVVPRIYDIQIVNVAGKEGAIYVISNNKAKEMIEVD